MSPGQQHACAAKSFSLSQDFVVGTARLDAAVAVVQKELKIEHEVPKVPKEQEVANHGEQNRKVEREECDCPGHTQIPQ